VLFFFSDLLGVVVVSFGSHDEKANKVIMEVTFSPVV
jgi:hypothetical protein